MVEILWVVVLVLGMSRFMSVDLFILDWLSRIVECLVRCGISCVCVLFGVFFIDSLSML